MTDLDKLIEAVEGGRLHTLPWMEFNLPPKLWPTVDTAYNGSLDAAKALHEALLPGWTRDVDATAPECGITVTLHRITSFTDGDTISADMACEARAWLIAILKAYRSQL